MIVGLDGTYTLPIDVAYRFSDSLLFDLKYVTLGCAFAFPTGFFRDRSQLSARVTYLLNRGFAGRTLGPVPRPWRLLSMPGWDNLREAAQGVPSPAR